MDVPMYDESWSPINPSRKDPLGDDTVEAVRRRRVLEVFDGMRKTNLLSLQEWKTVTKALQDVEDKRTQAPSGQTIDMHMIFGLKTSTADLRSVAELADSIWDTVRRARTEWDIRRWYPHWAEEVERIFSAYAATQWYDVARRLGVPADDGGYDPRRGLSS